MNLGDKFRLHVDCWDFFNPCEQSFLKLCPGFQKHALLLGEQVTSLLRDVGNLAVLGSNYLRWGGGGGGKTGQGFVGPGKGDVSCLELASQRHFPNRTYFKHPQGCHRHKDRGLLPMAIVFSLSGSPRQKRNA